MGHLLSTIYKINQEQREWWAAQYFGDINCELPYELRLMPYEDIQVDTDEK